jgi:hypothetical protein
LPTQATRQTEREPSSLTNSEPALSTATPTGLFRFRLGKIAEGDLMANPGSLLVPICEGGLAGKQRADLSVAAIPECFMHTSLMQKYGGAAQGAVEWAGAGKAGGIDG